MIGLIGLISCSNQKDVINNRWSKEKAINWYAEKGWQCGCNFTPSTAINQLEMWQKSTYDPETIDKELGWAGDLGFNIVRVYLHYLVWQENPKEFKERIDHFLEICTAHDIDVMFVLFDDCWYGNPQLGNQPDPVPGLHNSGWVQCPRYSEVMNPEKYPVFEEYTKDILTYFKDDDQVIVWDLYNEPANNHQPQQIFPLVKKVFQWARAVNPSQPLTMGVWNFGKEQYLKLNRFYLNNSDIITFHNYGTYEGMRKDIANFKSYGRPVICTEYIARTYGSKFQTHLPLMKEENVGAINWGLVSGKTQTIYPWNHAYNDTTIEVWHHDILHKDGSPYDRDEVELIKKLTQ